MEGTLETSAKAEAEGASVNGAKLSGKRTKYKNAVGDIFCFFDVSLCAINVNFFFFGGN